MNLKINSDTSCLFTRGISHIEFPVRHGEGKFYASEVDIERLFDNNQVVMQYADKMGKIANSEWPLNPNGSLNDIAGICDPTGRIFGLMPHPEAYNHFTNHPDWTLKKAGALRKGNPIEPDEINGIKIFQNAVDYMKEEIRKKIY